MPLPPDTVASPRRRLDSWKEIAAHLGRTVRTVQRWERDEQLPVHRHQHQRQASVYAFADEVDAWGTERRSAVEAAESGDDPSRSGHNPSKAHFCEGSSDVSGQYP
jgi:hypothetical protein